MKVRNAFTLVELLVVIGIIGVLIAILLPTLAKVQRQAQITQCTSNLRQLMGAAAIYQVNNKGAFPYQRAAAGGSADEQFSLGFVTQPNPLRVPAGRNSPPTSWVLHLARILVGPAGEQRATPGTTETVVAISRLRNLFECPTNRRDYDTAGTYAATEAFGTSYVANGVLTSLPRLRRNAATIVAFWDNGAANEDGSQCRPGWRVSSSPSATADGWSGWMYFGSPSLDPSAEKRLTARTHNGGTCMVFADGHAEYRLAPDVTARDVGLMYADSAGNERRGRPSSPSLGTDRNGVVVYEPLVDGYTTSPRLARVRPRDR